MAHVTAAAPAGALARFVEESRFGPFQLRVLVLCTLIAVVDGFDVTAMAAVAPQAAESLGVEPGRLGPALAASLVGLGVGGALGGWLGDRFGRRPSLIGMFIAGLVATALTATANSLPELVLWRFLTGLGLGGTIPLGAALCAEFMPKRQRTFLIVLMFTGHPVGGAIAGLAAPALIGLGDWRYMFLAGSLPPLLVAAALFALLPESPAHVAARGDAASLGRLLLRLDPARPVPAEALAPPPSAAARAPAAVGALFTDDRRRLTLLLWLAFFATQFNMFGMASWLPVLLNQGGLDRTAAIYAIMAFNLGGAAGSLGCGWLSDRVAPARVLAFMYVAAVAATLALSAAAAGPVATLVLCLLAGVGGIGAQLCLNALTTLLYPTAIRATGIGWALSVGRAGAILAPIVLGQLMLVGVGPRELLALIAAMPAIAAAAVLAFARVRTA